MHSGHIDPHNQNVSSNKQTAKDQLQHPKMSNSEKQDNNPPPGYPTETPPTTTPGNKRWLRTKKKGDRGFIEGCLFALCCCWLCEACC